MILSLKTNRISIHLLSTRVSCHHNDDISKISFTAIVVSKSAMVKNLEQQIEDFRVSLLNFIKQ